MGKTILFFYGSLRRGGANNFRVAGQEFLGDAVTLPRYRVLDLGTYTGMVRDAAGVAVPGEVWEVDDACLAALDAFEGPDYPRRPVEVVGWENVQAYLWGGDGVTDAPASRAAKAAG
jgi:gamma-glutamylcyclotransferase (GGCT)/AIG2-like uncharacterized protein YtfP